MKNRPTSRPARARPDPSTLDLAAGFEAARQKLGLTQEQCAALLGRPQAMISKIETGQRTMKAVELLKLLAGMDCRVTVTVEGKAFTISPAGAAHRVVCPPRRPTLNE